MAKSRKTGQSKTLTAFFILLVLVAVAFIARQAASSFNNDRTLAARQLPQLREDLMTELQMMGLRKLDTPGENGSQRFGHPTTMNSEDLILLLRRVLQRYNLILAAAVKYEERRELYVEITTAERLPVGAYTFSPGLDTDETNDRARGLISIIIDDFGYMRNRHTAGFINFPEKITFSVIPGHRFSQILAEEGQRAGHEIMVHMPMEPESYNGKDEEEYILLFGMGEEEVLARMRKAFQQIPQAIGMNNHEGSLATLDTVLLKVMARELKDRNKFFIDSYTTPNTKAEEIMAQEGVPVAGRKVFLDNTDDPGYIRSQLHKLAAIADRNGSAIGIGHVGASHIHTLDVLKEEIPLLKNQGYQFVFVSELLARLEAEIALLAD
ncbi:MAG: divergent polysaccharide deacetylase family protein [Candidatus Marinimicrobia bacterium]|nr:divergent polysaccharide deacetylase family protein [Candidatus Neomarinimicrobiota bacterium]